MFSRVYSRVLPRLLRPRGNLNCATTARRSSMISRALSTTPLQDNNTRQEYKKEARDPHSISVQTSPAMMRVLDFFGVTHNQRAGELARVAFLEATRDHWYDPSILQSGETSTEIQLEMQASSVPVDLQHMHVSTKFYGYLNLVALHAWVLHRHMRTLKLKRKFRSHFFEHLWKDFELKMEEQEGIHYMFVKKNLVRCQEQLYSHLISYDQTLDGQNELEFLVKLHQNIYNESNKVSFKHLLALRAYILSFNASVELLDKQAFLDAEIPLPRFVLPQDNKPLSTRELALQEEFELYHDLHRNESTDAAPVQELENTA